jgi:hypothetical protein
MRWLRIISNTLMATFSVIAGVAVFVLIIVPVCIVSFMANYLFPLIGLIIFIYSGIRYYIKEGSKD